jgi:hypothetical protein
MWAPWHPPGLEHLDLRILTTGVSADGVIVAVHRGEPFRLRYRVRCSDDWRVLQVVVDLLGGPDGDQTLALTTDGEGNWTDGAGRTIPYLTGCLDADISATPFTNTLAIRRLALEPGESRELQVAYIAVPELQCELLVQRYTRLEPYLYLYEGVASGFMAELPVDDTGLVLDYPESFRRVWPLPVVPGVGR